MKWGGLSLTLASLALGARAEAQSVAGGDPASPASPSSLPAPTPDQTPPPAPPYYAPPPAPPYAIAPALAQAPVGPPPIPLVLEGNRNELRMVLSVGEGEPPFARCRGRCVMSVLPGRYTLTVGATREVSQHSEQVDIEQPSRVTVTPQPSRQHPLALAGFIVVVSGVGLIALGAGTDDEKSESPYMLGGLLSVLTGIILMPIGAGLSTDEGLDVQVEPL